MSHSAWLTTPVSERAQGEQFAYVRGYILALEDILGDLEKMIQGYMGHEDGLGALGAAQEKVNETLASARQTLLVLEGMEHEQGEHGEVDRGPGELPG